MPVKTRTGIKHDRDGTAPHRVQGIDSSLDDLFIKGEKLKAVFGDTLIGGTLSRTIGGASSLSLEVLDINRHLLNSPLLLERHHLELDGLGFGFVKARSEGRLEPMELVYEPDVVLRLKDPRLKGPRKAYRAKVTRAEFAKRLVLLVKHPPRFICPELTVKQPVKSARDSRNRQKESDAELRKGLDDEAPVKVKGQTPTAAQGNLGDLALRIADEEEAPFRVQVALIAALIDETDMGATGGNVLQANPSGGGPPIQSNEDEIRGFLTGKPNWTIDGGAIGYFKNNPNAPPWEIAQAVQSSGTADGSNYREFVDEARGWVENRGGGEGSHTVTSFKKYAFEQKKNETIWACIGRLATEVRWRRFESHGWIYFIADHDLIDAKNRITIKDYGKGIIDTSFDYDVGKDITEFTVTARAKLWTAPPGSVVEVKDHGPANGRYLVNRIETPLAIRNSEVEITLHKEVEPLPEPAPTKVTKTIGGGGGGGAPGDLWALDGTPKQIVDRVVEYAHDELGFEQTPASVQTANASHGPTESGDRSDHEGPPSVAWAADISDGYMTKQEKHLAAAIAKGFGIPWSGAGSPSVTKSGYRIQLIFGVFLEGDHHDHVHIGVHVA